MPIRDHMSSTYDKIMRGLSRPKKELSRDGLSLDCFLARILSEGQGYPDYLSKMIDAEIVSITELCNFIRDFHTHVTPICVKNLVNIILKKRPDLFDAELGKILLTKTIRMQEDDLALYMKIIDQSGYVPDNERVLSFPFCLFEKFFDDSIPIRDLINDIRETPFIIRADVLAYLLEKIIREVVINEVEQSSLLCLLQISSAYISDSSSHLALVNCILFERSDHTFILKEHIIQMSQYIHDGARYLDVIDHMVSMGLCLETADDDLVYARYVLTYRVILDHPRISDRMKTYWGYTRTCISKSLLQKYNYLHLFNHQVFCEDLLSPKIPDELIETLLSPYESANLSLSFDERSRLLQAILSLMESDPAVSEYAQSKPFEFDY